MDREPPEEDLGQGGWIQWTETSNWWDRKGRWEDNRRRCEEPSMTIVATPDDGIRRNED